MDGAKLYEEIVTDASQPSQSSAQTREPHVHRRFPSAGLFFFLSIWDSFWGRTNGIAKRPTSKRRSIPKMTTCLSWGKAYRQNSFSFRLHAIVPQRTLWAQFQSIGKENSSGKNGVDRRSGWQKESKNFFFRKENEKMKTCYNRLLRKRWTEELTICPKRRDSLFVSSLKPLEKEQNIKYFNPYVTSEVVRAVIEYYGVTG